MFLFPDVMKFFLVESSPLKVAKSGLSQRAHRNCFSMFLNMHFLPPSWIMDTVYHIAGIFHDEESICLFLVVY